MNNTEGKQVNANKICFTEVSPTPLSIRNSNII